MKKSIIAALAASTLLMSCNFAHACYSEGYRTGYVQKLSKKGIAFKSYEGELVLDGMKFGRHTGGNIWKFSSKDANVFQTLEQAMGTDRKVTVKYCEGYFNVTTDTAHVVTGVTLN